MNANFWRRCARPICATPNSGLVLECEPTCGTMTTIPLQQAIEMCARASRTWFGPNAASKTFSKVQEAAAQGDAEAVEIWSKVLDEIKKLDAVDTDAGASSPE
jgi:hypothetical protein